MFEKIRKAFVMLVVLCLVSVPVAHASPMQYVDELGQGWGQILDFLEDFVASVWSNSESEGTATEVPPDSGASSTADDGSDGDDGSGDDGGDGSPEFGPIVDPIG